MIEIWFGKAANTPEFHQAQPDSLVAYCGAELAWSSDDVGDLAAAPECRECIKVTLTLFPPLPVDADVYSSDPRCPRCGDRTGESGELCDTCQDA